MMRHEQNVGSGAEAPDETLGYSGGIVYYNAEKLSVAAVIRHREYLSAFDSDLNPVFHQEARNVVRN